MVGAKNDIPAIRFSALFLQPLYVLSLPEGEAEEADVSLYHSHQIQNFFYDGNIWRVYDLSLKFVGLNFCRHFQKHLR